MVSATSCDYSIGIEKLDTLIIIRILAICPCGQKSYLSNLQSANPNYLQNSLLFQCLTRSIIDFCNRRNQTAHSRGHLRTFNKDTFIKFWEGLRDSLENTSILGKPKDKRRRRQQKMRWLESTTDSMDMNLSKLWEIVKDREAQRTAVYGTAKSQTWFSD